MTCHFPCDLTLMAFFLFFLRSGTVRFPISCGSHMQPFHSAFQPSNETINHGIVAYVFDSVRTPNSFFVDCFSFEANCFWKHQCVFSQLCIQLVRSKQVCDQQSGVQCPSVIQVPHCACVN